MSEHGQLSDYLSAMRDIAVESGLKPSMKPDRFDTDVGKRLHRQFWVVGQMVNSSGISQAADSEWLIIYNIAWQPTAGRSDPDFGLFDLLEFIAQLNVAWMSDTRLCWTEPISISTATPEWDEDAGAWFVAVSVNVLERRTWVPTSP